MPEFSYVGRLGKDAVSGVLTADSADAVAEALRAQGVVMLHAQVQKPVSRHSRASVVAWLRDWSVPQVTSVDMLLLTRQLHTLMRAGVPLLQALSGLIDSATNLRMQQTLGHIRRSLESGVELSQSFALHPKIFDHFFVAMVRVGEMTGRLDTVFLRLHEHMEFDIYMRQQVVSAIRYPKFVLLTMVVAMVVINLLVIPAFEGVFRSLGTELPLPTRVLLATSRFSVEYGWALLLLAGAATLGGRLWIRRPQGRGVWDRLVLRIPVAGPIIHQAELARFARNMALSLRSGLPVERAIAVVAQTCDNSYLAQRVDAMRSGIERGESLTRVASASGVFTPVVLQMVAVGEETGAVDDLLNEVANLYSNEVQYALKTLSQQIEPILIVLMGALVLLLAMGVFLPIWDLGRVTFNGRTP